MREVFDMRVRGVVLCLVFALLGFAGVGRAQYQTVKGGVEDLKWKVGTFSRASRLSAGGTVSVHGMTPVNVLAYGVDNTGATDCTDSLQAVIDSVAAWGGGVVYLPSGTYTISDSLLIGASGIVLAGDGPEATNIVHSCASCSAPMISNGGAQIYSCGVRDMKLTMASGTSCAIDFDDAAMCFFERLDIRGNGSSGAGIVLDRSAGSGYYNTLYGVSVNGYSASDTLSYGFKFLSVANENRLVACRTVVVDTAVYIAGANGNHIIGCSFENFDCGVRLPDVASQENTVSDCRFESGDVGVLAGSNTTTSKLSNNYYTSVATPVLDPNSVLYRSNDYGATQVGYFKFRSGGGMNGALYMRGNRIRLGSDDTSVSISYGSGSPEGVVTAPIGSLYLRTDGGSSTALYVKESGTGNTGWVAK